MKFRAILVLVGAAALAVSSFGQGFRGGGMMMGGGSPTFLLMRDDVKKDLNLTDDQKAKLQELRDGMMPKFGELRGLEAAARTKAIEKLMKESVDETNKILTADQQKRLKEINVQVSGNAAAAQPDVQKDLGLDEAQVAKIKDLMTRQQTATRELFTKVRNGEMEQDEAMKLVPKNMAILNEEIGKVFKPEQVEKFKAMAGKKFTPDPPPGGGN